MLTKQKKTKVSIGRYVSEARRMSIPVSLPHINKSLHEISYVEEEIYYGFGDIKGLFADENCHEGAFR